MNRNFDPRRALDIADRCMLDLPPGPSTFFDHTHADVARSREKYREAGRMLTGEDFLPIVEGEKEVHNRASG